MTAPAPDTRTTILQAAYALFYRQGFARVSVDAIANRAGVTKRTVYYHFNSKDDIVAEVLDVQHRHMMHQYENWLERTSDTAASIISQLFTRLQDWAESPDWLGSGFSRITSELADLRGHPARRAARLHKAEVETWLTEHLRAVGANDPPLLASQVMILIEGSMALTLIHGDTRYIHSAMLAAQQLAESHS